MVSQGQAVLNWEVAEDGFVFRVVRGPEAVTLSTASRLEVATGGGSPVELGIILRLLDDEDATENRDGSVAITHTAVAGLTPVEAAGLGLPQHLPHTLEIEATTNLPDPNFKFAYRLWPPGGGPAAVFSRTGALIRISGTKYLVPDPYFTLVEGMDSFNASPPETQDGRFAAWANLQEYLPEDARVDAMLKRIKIALADTFRLEPFVNEQGDVDFDPLPGRAVRQDELLSGADGEFTFEESFPPNRQADFAKRFRHWDEARVQYPVGAGTYIVFTRNVKKALEVVRERQRATPTERRQFLESPRTVLRDALEGTLEEAELDAVLVDTGYSERVEGVGIWQPKVLPWLKRESDIKWMPEEFGVRVGDQLVKIEPEDVDRVRQEIDTAIQEGKAKIQYKGQNIPATREALDVIRELVGLAKPEQKPEKGEKGSKEKKVLLVTGNLEFVGYEAAPRRTKSKPGSLPACLPSNLPLPHQLDAIHWLQDHWCSGSPGALLADDMGLGKTLEALAMLAWVKEEMESGFHSRKPILIVAPTGLLKNWVDEHNKHLDAPGIGAVVEGFGSSLKALRRPGTVVGKELQSGGPVLLVDELRDADWVLTTYETWRDYQHSFCLVDWSVAVFDEAQKIKNPAAAVTDAAKAVKADFVLALTGTPVENRLADLWSIIDAVQPGRLGALKDFVSTYEVKDPGQDVVPLQELRTTLLTSEPAIMKRRLKEDHLDGLPEKRIEYHKSAMPAVQAKAYQDAVNHAKSGEAKQGRMLEVLHALRSISLHPGPTPGSSDWELIQESARLIVTLETLDQIRDRGEKALLFIESREMQGILSGIFQRRYDLPGPPLIINGAVSGAKRKDRVDEFQGRSGFDVMLLSPKAGGVGLTLTAANHVIHLSRWWNPAVEDQCSDRVFRIGQEKPVFIHYPLAVHPELNEHSFDAQLDELLQRKRQLSRTVLAPSSLSNADVKHLFDETVHVSANEGTDMDLAEIDQMEPLQFEDWVLDQLRAAGYTVSRTPTSGDAGADGIARAPEGSGWRDIIVQCKHTSDGNTVCGEDGVEEVLASQDRYDVRSNPRLIVASNGRRFTDQALRVARAGNVELFARTRLHQLRTMIDTELSDGVAE